MFFVRVSDADGAADLSSLNLLINSTFDGASGCWLYYDIPNKQLTIHGDGGWGTALLARHIGDKRADGFHAVQSLVVFTGIAVLNEGSPNLIQPCWADASRAASGTAT